MHVRLGIARSYSIGDMGTAARQQRISEANYLAGERDAAVRHEYVDGVLFAMTGASRAHNLIATNLTALLRTHLRGSGCRVASSDMKVRLAEGRRYYYPDLIVSGSVASDEPDPYTETRPVLLIEILSTSTEQTDRREKLLAYQAAPDLIDYLIVSQSVERCERFSRDGDGWTRALFGPGESITLASVGLELDVVSIYEEIVLDAT